MLCASAWRDARRVSRRGVIRSDVARCALCCAVRDVWRNVRGDTRGARRFARGMRRVAWGGVARRVAARGVVLCCDVAWRVVWRGVSRLNEVRRRVALRCVV